MKFIKDVKQRYGTEIRAVCESTANYWMRLHDTLEENDIDAILAHPPRPE